MVDNPITLDGDLPPEQSGIAFDPGFAAPLPPSIADERATKADFGLKGTAAQVVKGDVSAALQAGKEDDIRTDAASKLNDANQKVKVAALSQLLGKNIDQPLTQEDYQQIQNAPFSRLFDPSSVFEINYGSAYVGALEAYAGQQDNNPFNILKQFPTNDADAIKEYGSSSLARYEYIKTKLQNRAAQIQSQSLGEYLLDLGLNFSGIYTEAKERGNVPGVGYLDGGLLSGNLQAQMQGLWSRPFGEFTKLADQIDANLDGNPQTAAAFWSAMLGQPSTDAFFNGLNTVGTVAGIAGAVPKAIKVGKVVYDTASTLNQVRKAFSDVRDANAVGQASTANVKASVGDIPGAAADQLATQGMSTNPTADALNTMDRFSRVDMANIEKDPGTLTTTQANIIREQYNTFVARIKNTLMDVLRPTRLPIGDASPEEFQAIAKSTFDRYPGMSNAVIKLEDPSLEPISNTYHVTGWIGRRGGEFFSSEEEAINYAREHGLAIKYTDDQLNTLKARIADLESEIKAGPDMDADTAGLNRYFGLDKQLKDLREQFDQAQAVKRGAVIGSAEKPITKVQAEAKAATAKRIGDIKSELSEMDMHADTAGMNRYDALSKELQSLEAEHGVIDQNGFGYFIKVTKPLNETDRVIRDWIVNGSRKSSQTPSLIRHMFGGFVNKAITAEDTMSAEHTAMRKAAVYPIAKLLAIAHFEAKNIKALSRGKFFNKTEWNRFNEVLRFSQDMPSPVDGVPGHYFESPAELQQHYMTTYGELPSFKAQQAYFAVKRWSEYDLMLRELGLYRNKSRLGAETHRLVLTRAGAEIRSAAFDGVTRNKMPGGSGNILVAGDGVESSKVLNLSKMSRADKDKLTKEIQEGRLKLTEIYDPHQYPLKGMGINDGESTIQYVLAPAEKLVTSPLTWEQLPFRGGGHIVYDYAHYVKQAIIDSENVDGVLTKRYKGDKTVIPVSFRKQGQDFADKMNAVREALRLGKEEEAKAIAIKHLPFEWKELRNKFMGFKDADGNFVKPALSLEQEFKVVPKNLTISQLDQNLKLALQAGDLYKDDTRSTLARNFAVEFTGERDAEQMRSVRDVGTRANPIFNWRPAEKVDPIKIMNRSLGSIIRSTFMDDYKTYAVEAWLKEALPHLNEDPKVIMSSPFFYFKTASKDMFLPGTDKSLVNRLMANQFKINQLVGTPSAYDTFLHDIAQKVLDASYSKLGPGFTEKIPAAWTLDKLRDPFAFIRGLTFNAYLGVFAPWQIFVQMASYVNMVALTPKYGVSGTFASLLHGYGLINRNPEILDHLDKMATKLGIGDVHWRPGEWKEAHEALLRTGFNQVGGEYGPLSTLNYAKPINSGLETFLNWGRKPFQMGESATRVGAWYIAFKEFRDANPTGAISKADLQKILNRADLLYGNMSTASSSVLHSGILSLPMQFYQYTIRLAEIFWSKRIGETAAERSLARARLIATNMAMFGAPMAFGMTGLPVASYLRQQQLEDAQNLSIFNPIKYLRYLTGTDAPYSVNKAQASGSTKDWIEHFFMEGLPSTMLSMATGNNYNIGPRYGSQGMENLRQLLLGDGGMWKIATGAPGALLSNVFGRDLAGFVTAVKSIFNGDIKKFPMTVNDWVDALRSIQTVNKGDTLVAALRTGKWFNRNDDFVMNVSPYSAFFMTLFGLEPQEQADTFNVRQNLNAQEDQLKTATHFFKQEMNRAVQAQADNNPEMTDKYLARAMFWITAYNVNDNDFGKIMANAYSANEPLISRVNWSRYVQHAPDALADKYRQTFSDIYNHLK